MPIGTTFGCLLTHTSIDKILGIISRQMVTDTVAHDDARLREGLLDPRIRFDRARKRSIVKSNGCYGGSTCQNSIQICLGPQPCSRDGQSLLRCLLHIRSRRLVWLGYSKSQRESRFDYA